MISQPTVTLDNWCTVYSCQCSYYRIDTPSRKSFSRVSYAYDGSVIFGSYLGDRYLRDGIRALYTALDQTSLNEETRCPERSFGNYTIKLNSFMLTFSCKGTITDPDTQQVYTAKITEFPSRENGTKRLTTRIYT